MIAATRLPATLTALALQVAVAMLVLAGCTPSADKDTVNLLKLTVEQKRFEMRLDTLNLMDTQLQQLQALIHQCAVESPGPTESKRDLGSLMQAIQQWNILVIEPQNEAEQLALNATKSALLEDAAKLLAAAESTDTSSVSTLALQSLSDKLIGAQGTLTRNVKEMTAALTIARTGAQAEYEKATLDVKAALKEYEQP